MREWRGEGDGLRESNFVLQLRKLAKNGLGSTKLNRLHLIFYFFIFTKSLFEEKKFELICTKDILPQMRFHKLKRFLSMYPNIHQSCQGKFQVIVHWNLRNGSHPENLPPSAATDWSRWPCAASRWPARCPAAPAKSRSSWRADWEDWCPQC